MTSAAVSAPVDVAGADRRSPALTAALPFLALAGVVVLWGMGPPLSKMVTAPALTIVFVRLWLAVPVMTAIQFASGTRPNWATLKATFLGGIMFGANMVAFFAALRHASIATLTVIAALQPGLVMLLAGRVFGEKITRWGVSWTLVSIGGAGIAVLGAGAKVHTSMLGVVYSVLTLLAMAVYFLAAKTARKTVSASDYIAGVMFWAAVAVTPAAVVGHGFDGFGSLGRGDLGWILLILIGPGVAGHLLMSWALRFVPVSLSSMAMIGTTVVSILAAWPIHHEPVTLLQVLGGAIALGGVAAVSLRRTT